MSYDKNCITPKATCNNSEIVNNFINILDEFREKKDSSNLSSISPFSNDEINIMDNALKQYKIECGICASEGRNDRNCLEQAESNLIRRFPKKVKDIYPWKNYDWSYGNYVSNNYSVENTGATTDGSLQSLRKNANAFSKLVDGFITDPIPNEKSKPASDDINSDYPYLKECRNNPMCRTTQKVRRMLDQEKPNKDKFFDKKLDGEYSSSFYFKVGSCPRDDITTEKDCKEKGYIWTPIDKTKGTGSCSMDRYAFVDNSPKAFFNGSNTKGLVTTMANDLAIMSPDKIFASLMGQSISDSYVIQPCPNITKQSIEKFNDYSNNRKEQIIFYISLSIFLLSSVYLYKVKK